MASERHLPSGTTVYSRGSSDWLSGQETVQHTVVTKEGHVGKAEDVPSKSAEALERAFDRAYGARE